MKSELLTLLPNICYIIILLLYLRWISNNNNNKPKTT